MMRNIGVFGLLCSILFLVHCKNPENNQDKITIHIIGDSTVKNGQGKGDGGLWGWGDFINQFVDSTKAKVRNHALGGTSSRTFQTQGLWDDVKPDLHEGDYLLIQFGHNDSGAINDSLRARGTIEGTGDEIKEIDNILTGEHETVHSYGWYLRKVVKEAKLKGVIPVLISPIPRNIWNGGHISNGNDSYRRWTKEIAAEENVVFVDLNHRMVDSLNSLSKKEVTGTFFYKRDHTHTSARGAVLAASLVAKEIQELDQNFSKYFLQNPNPKLPHKKNIYLIGDSTVANNNDVLVGWGRFISRYFDTIRVKIHNKARGGRSSRAYYSEGLWQEVKDSLRPSDFVFIQFGHNDGGNIDKPKYRGSIPGIGEEIQKVEVNRDSFETVHTYGWYLRQYINDTKSKNATPIIFSMVPRNIWHQDSVERNSDSYAGWAKEIAKEMNVPFVDLNDSIAVEYERLGKKKVEKFFPKDHTHTNDIGAQFSAGIIAKLLKSIRSTSIHDYVKEKDD